MVVTEQSRNVIFKTPETIVFKTVGLSFLLNKFPYWNYWNISHHLADITLLAGASDNVGLQLSALK